MIGDPNGWTDGGGWDDPLPKKRKLKGRVAVQRALAVARIKDRAAVRRAQAAARKWLATPEGGALYSDDEVAALVGDSSFVYPDERDVARKRAEAQRQRNEQQKMKRALETAWDAETQEIENKAKQRASESRKRRRTMKARDKGAKKPVSEQQPSKPFTGGAPARELDL